MVFTDVHTEYFKCLGSSENGWPSDLKSRIKTDTSVVIGTYTVVISKVVTSSETHVLIL